MGRFRGLLRCLLSRPGETGLAEVTGVRFDRSRTTGLARFRKDLILKSRIFRRDSVKSFVCFGRRGLSASHCVVRGRFLGCESGLLQIVIVLVIFLRVIVYGAGF